MLSSLVNNAQHGTRPVRDPEIVRQWIQASAWMATLTDGQLATLLEALVWVPLPVCTPQSDAVLEAIRRLRGETGARG